jgi:hypothetical protein
MSRGIDPYNKKALDYDSRGLWLNGVAVEMRVVRGVKELKNYG